MFPRPGVERDYPEGEMGFFCGSNVESDQASEDCLLYYG